MLIGLGALAVACFVLAGVVLIHDVLPVWEASARATALDPIPAPYPAGINAPHRRTVITTTPTPAPTLTPSPTSTPAPPEAAGGVVWRDSTGDVEQDFGVTIHGLDDQERAVWLHWYGPACWWNHRNEPCEVDLLDWLYTNTDQERPACVTAPAILSEAMPPTKENFILGAMGEGVRSSLCTPACVADPALVPGVLVVEVRAHPLPDCLRSIPAGFPIGALVTADLP